MTDFRAYVGRMLRQGRFLLPLMLGVPLVVVWLLAGPLEAIVVVGACALLAFPLGYLRWRRRG